MIDTIHAAAQAVRDKKVSPLDLLEQCLAQVDRHEKSVKAWVFLDREGARADAERLTAELKNGQYRGPLHGIPIGIKDIFDVYDWPTAAGSKRWASAIARHDAPLVARLRQAGAVLMGKTVTTQFASFDPPVTRNPWNLERTPGGSSSGSAAALATAMCLGALGSQTGGSITRPASYCGVCGLKPAFGMLPLAGIVPLAPPMDHPGPMTRCVRDLAILLNVLASGPADGHDSSFEDFEASVLGGVDRPRLGVVRGLFEDRADPSVRADMESVRSRLAAANAELIPVQMPTAFAEVIARHRIIMAVDAAVYHRERLQKHPEDYGPKIRSLLEEGLRYGAADYAITREHQRQLTEDMQHCFAAVDALLVPATTGPAPAADSTGDPAFNSPWSYVGYPAASFPTGQFVDGLPLALQLIGLPGDEARLLAVAAWCERVLGVQPLKMPPPSDATSR